MRWNIDPTHSAAEFSVRHLMITNVKGRFGALSGTVDSDAATPQPTKSAVTRDPPVPVAHRMHRRSRPNRLTASLPGRLSAWSCRLPPYRLTAVTTFCLKTLSAVRREPP